jgi:single-stranded DNA-binding protein
MTAYAIVTGTLFKAPEQRTSKAGKPFVAATIRAKDGEVSQWWRIVAFSDTAQAELMRLGDGDGVAVQGALKAELYQPDGGEPKISLSLVADRVLALRPKKRTASAPQRRAWSPGDGPDDEIPFGAP